MIRSVFKWEKSILPLHRGHFSTIIWHRSTSWLCQVLGKSCFCFKWRSVKGVLLDLLLDGYCEYIICVILALVTTAARLERRLNELLPRNTTSFPRRHCALSSEPPPKSRRRRKRWGRPTLVLFFRHWHLWEELIERVTWSKSAKLM